MEEYECPNCGANQNSKAVDCCSTCIVAIWLDNPSAPSIDQYSRWIEYGEEEED